LWFVLTHKYLNRILSLAALSPKATSVNVYVSTVSAAFTLCGVSSEVGPASTSAPAESTLSICISRVVEEPTTEPRETSTVQVACGQAA